MTTKALIRKLEREERILYYKTQSIIRFLEKSIKKPITHDFRNCGAGDKKNPS